MPRRLACLYDVYGATYDAVLRALRHDDAAAVQACCTSVWRLDGAEACTAAQALTDAMNRFPKRARVHICRLQLSEGCSSGHCALNR